MVNRATTRNPVENGRVGPKLDLRVERKPIEETEEIRPCKEVERNRNEVTVKPSHIPERKTSKCRYTQTN